MINHNQIITKIILSSSGKDAGGVTPGVTECIDNVRAVQAAMLRYGRIKVQLQACKVRGL